MYIGSDAIALQEGVSVFAPVPLFPPAPSHSKSYIAPCAALLLRHVHGTVQNKHRSSWVHKLWPVLQGSLAQGFGEQVVLVIFLLSTVWTVEERVSVCVHGRSKY